MRPVLAIIGTALLVLLGLLSYFVPGGYSTHGDVSIGSPEMVDVPSSTTFLSSLPVTLTMQGVPPGATITVLPCPVGASSASACTGGYPQFLYTYNVSSSDSGPQTVVLRFNINAGHPFLINTTAGYGAQTTYTAQVPLWAEQTWIIVALLVAGIVIVAVGLTSTAPSATSPYVDMPAYAGGPPAKRFCENCGNPFPDASADQCPACGAPRWG